MYERGNWLRSRTTGEVFKITRCDEVITYQNHERGGELPAGDIPTHFEVIDTNAERDDVERLLRALIRMGEAQPGLYMLGVAALLMEYGDNGSLTARWFDHPIVMQDLL